MKKKTCNNCGKNVSLDKSKIDCINKISCIGDNTKCWSPIIKFNNKWCLFYNESESISVGGFVCNMDEYVDVENCGEKCKEYKLNPTVRTYNLYIKFLNQVDICSFKDELGHQLEKNKSFIDFCKSYEIN